MAPRENSRAKVSMGEGELSKAQKQNKTKHNQKGKSQKKGKKGPKIVRIMKQQPITFYSCNANHITNKMPTLAHATNALNYDVIHITEAGLQKKQPNIMKGYKTVKHEHDAHNRRSAIWVK